MSRIARIALLAAVCSLAGCGGEESATAKVPPSFFGVATQQTPSDIDFARMAAGNVGSYHLFVSWAAIESTPGSYDWSRYDAIMEQLARHGIEATAVVLSTPEHLASNQSVPPVRSRAALKAYKRFLRRLARRYGPDGSFWGPLFALQNPGVEPRPVRVWEVWNEPNGPAFWAPRPDPAEYAKLLKRSAAILHGLDPGAQVMIAGMFATPSSPKAINSFKYLRQLYRRKGVAAAADLVGIHPYGPRIKDVRRQMAKTREIIRESGDRDASMFVTEIGWGSDPSARSQLSKTPRRQAALLRRTYKMMINKRERWRVRGVLWFAWRDTAAPVGACGWCPSSGLLDDDLDAKPAWMEFTRLTGGSP